MTVIVPIYPKSPNGGTRKEHWSLKIRRERQEKFLTEMMLNSERSKLPKEGRPKLPAKVTITLLHWGLPRDDDNLVASMKAVRDAIAKWLGLKDDSDPRVYFVYAQEKTKKFRIGTRIEICPA